MAQLQNGAPCRVGKSIRRGGTGPLNLLIDATGIKAEGEGEWNACKHGGIKKRLWCKLHLGMDEETLEIRAVEVTTSNVGDAPILPALPIKSHQMMRSPPSPQMVPTIRENAMMLSPPETLPPLIPPRKNARPWKPDTAGAIARNDALRATTDLGRALWLQWSGYHRRSRAETKMNCVKRRARLRIRRSALLCAKAAAEPAASNSRCQVLNCPDVTPGSPARLAWLTPSSDKRATACSLYSGVNRRLVCFVILVSHSRGCFNPWSGITGQGHSAILIGQCVGENRDFNAIPQHRPVGKLLGYTLIVVDTP